MYKVVNYLKKEKNLLVFLSLIVAGYVIYFKFYLNRPFLLSNDQWFQYNVFYKEWLRLVIGFFKGEALPMYSQNMYLGTDFYSAMGYYCTGDIFLPILLIFHNNVELGLIIETIICFYLSAVFMSKCLEIYDIKDAKIRIFISLIYALGGYANQFLGNYMFYRFYAFLPLLFYGLRHYFINKYIYI